MTTTKYDPEAAAEQLAAARPADYFLGFFKAMVNAELLGADTPYFLDKPHKWATEFALWMDYDCPESDDDPHWDEWVAAVEEL